MKKYIALLLSLLLLLSNIAWAEDEGGVSEPAASPVKTESEQKEKEPKEPDEDRTPITSEAPETQETLEQNENDDHSDEDDAEQTDGTDGEPTLEVDEKLSSKKLSIKPVDAPTAPIVRPLLAPFELQFRANSKKNVSVTITFRLGKKGKKYKVTTPTNEPAILEIPAADINAQKTGKIWLFVSFEGSNGIKKIDQTKLVQLTLQDQRITVDDPCLTEHYQRDSGLTLHIDVPLNMPVAVPGFVPNGQLAIGKVKFTSKQAAPGGELRFTLTPDELDAFDPGAYDLMFSIPESKKDNVAAYSAHKIGTLVITDCRALPVYQGGTAQLRHHVGQSTDLVFPVKFISDSPETVTLTGYLSRKDTSYPLSLSGNVSLDATNTDITIDGAALKKLKAGKYTFTYSTVGTSSNQPSGNVTREFLVGNPPDITITRSSLPEGKTGKKYSYTLTTKGSPDPEFELESGALPRGLRISSTGVISGTPSKAGTFSFTVSAYNGFEPQDVRRYSIKITGKDIEEEETEETEDVDDQNTPLSLGDEVPVVSNVRAKGESKKGVATLTGLEAPTLTRLLRADSITPSELVLAVRNANQRAVPLDTTKIPSGDGVKLPLVVNNNKYIGFARFLPATDKKGKPAYTFELELISGTHLSSIKLPDGKSVPDVQLCLTQIGRSGTQSKFYTEPGALISQSGMVFVELAVGVSYHPESSPEYTFRRVDVAALKALSED